ncbi:hypothetical protein O4J55_24205, partial [Paracoccus sp. PXZ]
SRRFCCHQCSVEATKRHGEVACAQCGVVFRATSARQRFCSPSCVAKHKHATGVLRYFPRKLTARLADRMFAEMRPKRPYRRRLTAERFDVMFGR